MAVMSTTQLVITIAILTSGTVITRFLPFLIFGENRPTPKFIEYLGKALPSAIFAMLIVYCFKDVSLLSGNHGLPAFIAIAVTAGIHLWKRSMMLSMLVGTVVYMLLIHFVFV